MMMTAPNNSENPGLSAKINTDPELSPPARSVTESTTAAAAVVAGHLLVDNTRKAPRKIANTTRLAINPKGYKAEWYRVTSTPTEVPNTNVPNATRSL